MGQPITAYLDTQVCLWLSAGKVDLVSAKALEMVEAAGRLLVSPMAVLEFEYLYESKRITERGNYVLADLSWKLGLQVCQLSMAMVAASALDIKWTRDPFDRLIVANAMANKQAPLISADRNIRSHYLGARW